MLLLLSSKLYHVSGSIISPLFSPKLISGASLGHYLYVTSVSVREYADGV